MKCPICTVGETEAGHTTAPLERGDTAVVIKDVSAQVCGNCGEYYLREEITEQVMKAAEEAVSRGLQVEVVNYAA